MVCKGGNVSQWSALVPLRVVCKCWGMLLRVIGSATKSASACPHHDPGNAVLLQLRDNGIRRGSGAFRDNRL